MPALHLAATPYDVEGLFTFLFVAICGLAAARGGNHHGNHR